MPAEIGYQRQVTPQAPAAMPLTSPDDYGAGLARTAGQAATIANDELIQDYRVTREKTVNEQWAAFQHGYALHRQNMDGIAREAGQDASAGHAARMGEAWDASRDALLGTITEDKVRREAANTFDEGKVAFVGRAAQVEDVQRVAGTLTNLSQAENLDANALRRLDDPSKYPELVRVGRDRIAGLDIPAEAKAKAAAEWDEVAGVSYAQGVIDRDPQLAKAMLAHGLFDNLKPEAVEQLGNAADVEIRRQQAQAEHAVDLQKHTFHQDVAVTKADASAGQDVTDRLPALIKTADQLGERGDAEELRILLANGKYQKIYEPQTPVQRESRERALEAILPDKRSPEQATELHWLQEHRDGLDAAFNKNPVDFFIRNGGPSAPPPLDPANPATIDARAQWARATAATVGRPVPPLSSNEAALVEAHWRTGQTTDQRQVLDQLARFPADLAAAAARQVAPDDPTLEAMAALGSNTRNLALVGRDVLKANPALLTPKLPGTNEKDTALEQTLKAYDAGLDQALTVFPPEQRIARLETAKRIAAGLLDQHGVPLTAQRYYAAMNMALGATTGPDGKQNGGLAKWGDHWFVVPPAMGKNDFGAAVMRATAKMKVGPVNPDGSPAVLARAYPVFVGNGFYEFHTASGGVVKGSDHKVWRVRP